MKILKTTLCFLLVAVAIHATAQSKEDRSLSSFDRLSVGEAITVYLTQGSSESATVEISGADLDDVVTEVSGNRLKIEMEGNRNYRDLEVTVYVTYRSLDELSVSSAADLYTRGPIKASSLEIDVSSAGDAEVEVDVDELIVEVSSSGDLTVSGNANSQKVGVSSAGSYYGYDMTSKSARVNVSSAGSAKVNVAEDIKASASSGGSVRYKGNPDRRDTNSSSGGSVRSS